MITNKKGFTLIELIVVMAIIAILAAAGLSSYTSTQKKGRDARRKSDLTQVSRALEFYYNDHGEFPDTSSGQIVSCGASCDAACVWGVDTMCSPTDPATIYMQTLPKDPSSNYQYYYYANNGTNNIYRLYSLLENTQDSQVITPAVSTDCDVVAAAACNYGISSTNASP